MKRGFTLIELIVVIAIIAVLAAIIAPNVYAIEDAVRRYIRRQNPSELCSPPLIHVLSPDVDIMRSPLFCRGAVSWRPLKRTLPMRVLGHVVFFRGICRSNMTMHRVARYLGWTPNFFSKY